MCTAGSSVATNTRYLYVIVGQLRERCHGMAEVVGLSPTSSTIKNGVDKSDKNAEELNVKAQSPPG